MLFSGSGSGVFDVSDWDDSIGNSELLLDPIDTGVGESVVVISPVVGVVEETLGGHTSSNDIDEQVFDAEFLVALSPVLTKLVFLR